MAEFQSECPIIKKVKKVYNRNGTFLYAYAPLESIVSQVKHLLYKHGFSYAIKSIPNNEYAEVSCIVKHIEGHEEISTLKFPLGNKTEIMSTTQYYAAAHTFTKRYVFCDAFGILTGNLDTDGRVEGIKEKEYISVAHVQLIRDLLSKTEYTEGDMLESAKVSKIEELDIQHAKKIIANLQSVIDKEANNS